MLFGMIMNSKKRLNNIWYIRIFALSLQCNNQTISNLTIMNYVIPQNLLSTNNAKTVKGEKLGITTYIMYLAPFTQNSKGINLCSHASEGCANACLFGSGSARFNRVQNGKRNKTEYFLHNRIQFLNQLVLEIERIVSIHSAMENETTLGRKGQIIRYKDFAIRLNGTSDISFEKFKIRDNKNIFELFPMVQFYDYTKNHLRFDRVSELGNYHLTFSRSETNDVMSMEILKRGFNVAMVFDQVPNEYKGYKVINGDETDLRFLDESNVIVGLKYKKLTSMGAGVQNKENLSNDGFVIKTTKNLPKWYATQNVA